MVWRDVSGDDGPHCTALQDQWARVPSMQFARRSPGVVAHRGRLYVLGGMGEKEDLSSVEVNILQYKIMSVKQLI